MATSPEPPPFEEASRCGVCKCSFTTFRRRHHCRCCGRTFCHEHSSYQMPLPQFDIDTSVRVCSDCFNDRSRKDNSLSYADRPSAIADAISTLDINGDSTTECEPLQQEQPALANPDCKCGMPLCICETSAPSCTPSSMQGVSASSSAPSNPRPKKADAMPKNVHSSQGSRRSSNSGAGQSSGSNKPRINYEVNGEGLREAIKVGDTSAVKELLSKGVDSNYCDKQGFFLLHLAALFNQTDIALVLMEHGAKLDCKNPQGETPLDCAPPTLQYKMRMKMEQNPSH